MPKFLPRAAGGGIETVLRLLTLLGTLGGDEEYVFITHWEGADWLKPLLTERQTIVQAPQTERRFELSPRQKVTQYLGPLRPALRRIREFISPETRAVYSTASSDGFYESLGCDVVHFPYQDFVSCSLPTIYNPHDLQHRHHPEFFEKAEIKRRDLLYANAFRKADTVVVASRYVKNDIVKYFATADEKIQVIPWSPPTLQPTLAQLDTGALLEKHDCPPGPFMLYPAVTWEHKNHIRLIEAIAELRDRDGIDINLICTGHKNSFFPLIEKRLSDLNLNDRIQFTGIVELDELKAFYGMAKFVVIPTLFEAASAPLFEAWQHGAPVTCSSITSLSEQACDAALLFNPANVSDIANAIKEMVFNDILRDNLRTRGYERLKDFDLDRTIKAYRAVYRRAAGMVLDDEDNNLLYGK